MVIPGNRVISLSLICFDPRKIRKKENKKIYTIRWHTASLDIHRIFESRSFSFPQFKYSTTVFCPLNIRADKNEWASRALIIFYAWIKLKHKSDCSSLFFTYAFFSFTYLLYTDCHSNWFGSRELPSHRRHILHTTHAHHIY